jgi:hypothetical protein
LITDFHPSFVANNLYHYRFLQLLEHLCLTQPCSVVYSHDFLHFVKCFVDALHELFELHRSSAMNNAFDQAFDAIEEQALIMHHMQMKSHTSSYKMCMIAFIIYLLHFQIFD